MTKTKNKAATKKQIEEENEQLKRLIAELQGMVFTQCGFGHDHDCSR